MLIRLPQETISTMTTPTVIKTKDTIYCMAVANLGHEIDEVCGVGGGGGRKVRRLSNMCVAINFGVLSLQVHNKHKKEKYHPIGGVGDNNNKRYKRRRWVAVCRLLPEITRKGAPAQREE